jgi:hypothetical protein
VKLRGRPEDSRALRSVFALRAREAPSLTTPHGPLQRLLEVTQPGKTVRVRRVGCKSSRRRLKLSAHRYRQTKTRRDWRAAHRRGTPPPPESPARAQVQGKPRPPHAHIPTSGVKRRRLLSQRVQCRLCSAESNEIESSDLFAMPVVPQVTSNGEVEGPGARVRLEPRAHTVFPRPRRATTHRSRTPPTIVSGHRGSFAPALHCPVWSYSVQLLEPPQALCTFHVVRATGR